MQFQVPQFIEREAKIIGPLTLKQFFFIGLAVAASFTIFFLIGKEHFAIFLVISIILIGSAVIFAFFKFEGLSLPVLFKNFINFAASSKMYLWKRKEMPVFFKPRVEKKIEKKEEDVGILKITEKSKLKNLRKKIELG